MLVETRLRMCAYVFVSLLFANTIIKKEKIKKTKILLTCNVSITKIAFHLQANIKFQTFFQTVWKHA